MAQKKLSNSKKGVPPKPRACHLNKIGCCSGIQCYTSEDVWLARGAWRRASVPNSGGAKTETMQPANSKVIPFLPAFTKEEQLEQQRQYRLASAGSLTDGPARPCRLYDSSPEAASQKLPLHLWVFLGGKDMQALDGGYSCNSRFAGSHLCIVTYSRRSLAGVGVHMGTM